MALGVLRQVDGGAHPQGQDHRQGHQDDVQGVEDVGQNADGVVDIAALGGEQAPADVGKAAIENIADEEDQQGAGDAGAQIQQKLHPMVIGSAGGRHSFHIIPPSVP